MTYVLRVKQGGLFYFSKRDYICSGKVTFGESLYNVL